MAGWILVPCLEQLFTEFNRIAPNRDTTSDGRIGDKAHQQTVSDHNPDETGAVPIHDTDTTNEVHAIDVDNNLREPGFGMEDVVQFILSRCRSGAENRLRYIIYYRRIWSASENWEQQVYTGASAHTEHAHFSASYIAGREASTASWHLEETPMALTNADKEWLMDVVANTVNAAVMNLITVSKQTGPDGKPTDDNTNRVGRAVLDFQEIPNRFRGEKTTLWVVLQDMQDAILDIRTILKLSE